MKEEDECDGLNSECEVTVQLPPSFLSGNLQLTSSFFVGNLQTLTWTLPGSSLNASSTLPVHHLNVDVSRETSTWKFPGRNLDTTSTPPRRNLDSGWTFPGRNLDAIPGQTLDGTWTSGRNSLDVGWTGSSSTSARLLLKIFPIFSVLPGNVQPSSRLPRLPTSSYFPGFSQLAPSQRPARTQFRHRKVIEK